MKILIVDDEVVSRKKMLKLIQNLGECYMVESGRQAFEFLADNPKTALILLDIIMPDMDGYEVYTRLKKNNATKDINVIFVTSLDQDEDEVKGFELGGMDYIIKPFSPKLVQAKVRNRLNMIQTQKQKQESAHVEKMVSMGSLALGLAHEINNPLAGMIQNAEVIKNRIIRDISANEKAAKKAGTTMEALRNYAEDREIVRQLDSIHESGIQAAKVIKRILEFMAGESSALIKEDIHQLLESSLSSAMDDKAIKYIAGLEELNIVSDVSQDVAMVLCDKRKLSMVFFSIFKNAIQAMEEDGAIIPMATLSWTVRKVANQAVIIITDNGAGMDEPIRQQAFDPLFSTREAGKGSGLDLSLVYFIVTQTHKGNIHIGSSLGKGSTLTIKLPSYSK